jgi:hypothetical protein
MKKPDEVRDLLTELNAPVKQRTDMCCLVMLALADIKEDTPWSEANNNWIRIHDIIAFIKEIYGVVYAENSRETIRKQALHPFRIAAFVEDNTLATNSPNYSYRLTAEFLEVLRGYNSSEWDTVKTAFLSTHTSLVEMYDTKRSKSKMPIQINGVDLSLSIGRHNVLQKAIIEEFAPRFAPNSECLYIGDTTKRDLFKNETALGDLGFIITLHDKMPDIVLYSRDKDWLYFIEAVTSVGSMDPKRIIELSEMTEHVTSGKIFVTAFPDFKTYKKFANSLAWDTEVWIAEKPDHMIHLNGDRFIGPR